ncbi:hypothetical protein D3C72_1089560 [compost metagenome]
MKPATPSLLAPSIYRSASRVLVSDTLARTGTRPPEASSAILATSSFSSNVKVLASPNEPQVTTPWMPLRI